MSSDKMAFYPWFPRDYMADTVTLSLEADGAYRCLLDYQWLHGAVPAGAREQGRICRHIHPNQMRKLWGELCGFFQPHPDRPGWLINARLERIRDEVTASRERRSAAGSKAVRERERRKKARQGRDRRQAAPTIERSSNDHTNDMHTKSKSILNAFAPKPPSGEVETPGPLPAPAPLGGAALDDPTPEERAALAKRKAELLAQLRETA